MNNEAQVPRRVGRWWVLHRLGRGPCSDVFAGMAPRSAHAVAIKLLHGVPADESTAGRLEYVAGLVGPLRHPGVVPIVETGVLEVDGVRRAFLVTAKIAGGRTVIGYARERELDQEARIRLFAGVCEAVDAAHRRRIVHRAIKPQNLLVDDTGSPHVVDLALAGALRLDAWAPPEARVGPWLARSIEYMSPEQLAPSPRGLTIRSDVYGLGAVLHELLTGHPPHRVRHLSLDDAAEIVREVPLARTQLRGDLPAILIKALARDRVQRYPSAGSLGRDLMRHVTRRPPRAGPRGRSRRQRLRRRRILFAAAILAAALVIVGGGILALGW